MCCLWLSHLALITGGGWFGCKQAGRGLQVSCGESAEAINPAEKMVKTPRGQSRLSCLFARLMRLALRGFIAWAEPWALVQHSYFLIWWEDKSLTYGLLLTKNYSLSDSIPGLSLCWGKMSSCLRQPIRSVWSQVVIGKPLWAWLIRRKTLCCLFQCCAGCKCICILLILSCFPNVC